MANLSGGVHYGVVPWNRRNLLLELSRGRVTVFCPFATLGSGLVTGVQTTGGRKLAALSKLTFHGFIGQAIIKLVPARHRLSGSVGTEVQRNRKNRLPGPMGTTTVICPPTNDGSASVTGVQTAGGLKSVVLSSM